MTLHQEEVVRQYSDGSYTVRGEFIVCPYTGNVIGQEIIIKKPIYDESGIIGYE